MASPHIYRRRVEFGDTDLAGIMHFANFFRFMEAAETDFLRCRGLSVSWRTAGVKYGFPRVSASCDYRRPARFEDLLEISVSVEKLGEKSVTYVFEFRIEGQAETEPIAVGRMTSVFCRSTQPGEMESQVIPVEIRARIDT